MKGANERRRRWKENEGKGEHEKRRWKEKNIEGVWDNKRNYGDRRWKDREDEMRMR